MCLNYWPFRDWTWESVCTCFTALPLHYTGILEFCDATISRNRPNTTEFREIQFKSRNLNFDKVNVFIFLQIHKKIHLCDLIQDVFVKFKALRTEISFSHWYSSFHCPLRFISIVIFELLVNKYSPNCTSGSPNVMHDMFKRANKIWPSL
jgi:hypothetical protein